MILVSGAAGQVGGAVLRALLEAKAEVRAMVRPGGRLSGLDGVNVVEADFADAASLVKALDGVEAAFLISPGDFTLERAFVEAAAHVDLGRVVLLSVLNADENSSCGILKQHGLSEGYLIESTVPYVILRPNAFMQNFVVQSAGPIKANGTLPGPMGDARVSFVDVRDIASVAAVALMTPAFEGETLELTGPQALSYGEAAAAIAKAAGRTVSYVNIPDADAKTAMLGMGMTSAYADAVLALFATYRDGDAEFVVPTVEEVTGKAARTFDAFVQENAAAFRP